MQQTDKTEENPEPVWAVVELMGHIHYGGLVSKDTMLGTPLLRVDVPQEDGAFATQLVNPDSIYRLTMCEEKLARAAAADGGDKPINRWELQQLQIESTPHSDNESRVFHEIYEDEEGDSCDDEI